MLHLHTFPNKFKNNEGYVALMSVLVISAVGLIIAVSLLTTGMIHQHSSFAIEEGYAASALAKACSNVALEKIRLNAAYLGSESVNFENNHCDILPISKDEDTYTINIEGIVGTARRKNKVMVSRTEDPDTKVVTMSIELWQEIADF